MSAEADWATRRCRAHTPTEQITLTRPVSSSRLTKVIPRAVSGRWRWVTTPATVHPGPVGSMPGSAGRR